MQLASSDTESELALISLDCSCWYGSYSATTWLDKSLIRVNLSLNQMAGHVMAYKFLHLLNVLVVKQSYNYAYPTNINGNETKSHGFALEITTQGKLHKVGIF